MKKMALSVLKTVVKIIKGILDPAKPIGTVNVTLRDKEGNIKCSDVFNLIVTSGKQHIADQLSGQLQASLSHMAIGSGTTGADLADIQLGNEISRKPFQSKNQGTGADANKIIYITEWPSGEGDGAISEAAMFNASSAGNMMCRTTFPVKNKGTGDSLTLTWTISIN